MTAPEFARRIPLDRIGTAPLHEAIEAGEAERAALAARFGWLALDALAADAELTRVAAGVRAKGRVRATLAQACSVTGEPVPAAVDTEFDLLFTDAAPAAAADEVELAAEDLDTMPIENGAVDLGEAAAQTVALALDPYPRAPGADAALGAIDNEAAGPFAGLAKLLKP